MTRYFCYNRKVYDEVKGEERMALFGKQRLGIDFGSLNTIIYVQDKGIALRESSVVAVKRATKDIIAYGKEAEALIGRTSDEYEFIYPVKEGVIADFTLAKQLLAHFIRKALHRGLSRPDLVVCVPSGISKVERRAMIDAVKSIGIGNVMLVEAPLAGALGANIPIYEPNGQLVVDIGAGTTDIGVISYGEIIHAAQSQVAGVAFNCAIIDKVRESYRILISEEVAETLKRTIGNAHYTSADANERYEVTGQQLATHLPVQQVIDARVIAEAIDESILHIKTMIRHLLGQTPPEMIADIGRNGIHLMGGGSLLRRLPERLEEELGVKVHLIQQPYDAVAIGAGKLLKELSTQTKQKERDAR